MAATIRVFKRAAWKRNKNYPGGWEPHVGTAHTVAWVETEDQAREICARHNKQRKSKGDPFCEFTQTGAT